MTKLINSHPWLAKQRYNWTNVTPNISHRYIKVKEEDRIDTITHKITTGQGIDNIVEAEIHHTEVEEIMIEIIDKIIEGDHETVLGMTIE